MHTVPAVTADTFALVTAAQSLASKTLVGGTTIGSSIAINSTNVYTIGSTSALLFSIATTHVVGGASNTSGHTVPNVADDTIALLAATQTFSNKTEASPTISGTMAGTFNIGGTPTLTANLTTNAFVGPNYGGTSTNVVTPAWTHFTLTNSWTDDLGVNISGYFKDAMGVVHVRMDVSNASTTTNAIATFPAGFRPGVNTSAVGWGSASNAFRSIQISTAGVITPNVSDTRFNGFFTFMAEN
jgi:hypothetical protein